MNEQMTNIINNLERKNDQNINVQSVNFDLETDWTLAYQFYNFLINRSNKLPDFFDIENVVNNTKSYYLSIGCGVDVTFQEGNKNSLIVTITEPINDKVVRVDKISKDSYEAYTLVNDKFYREINIEKLPRFDYDKIEELQNFLDLYSKSRTSGLNL